MMAILNCDYMYEYIDLAIYYLSLKLFSLLRVELENPWNIDLPR